MKILVIASSLECFTRTFLATPRGDNISQVFRGSNTWNIFVVIVVMVVIVNVVIHVVMNMIEECVGNAV